jgi:hypothetical protein
MEINERQENVGMKSRLTLRSFWTEIGGIMFPVARIVKENANKAFYWIVIKIRNDLK